ncbi:universal stress protein [Salegentibacter chungangensis]|uniref:Universal stress protein n=1 Tax=Salegentibacter chungangensis TaxID=1335724 RepID=A0ABW3NPT7_9FLAO
MKEINNILVAIDFNDAVGDLLGYAESIAEKYGSKIWIVHVAEPEPDFVGYEPGPQYIRDMKAEEFQEEHRTLQSLTETFIDKSIPSEALLIQGSTVDTVMEEAEKLNCDLLVLGTHKHSFLHNLLGESVSLEILKKSSFPMLTVPIEED